MPCQLRPDERQHGCNQGSNKGRQRLDYAWKPPERSDAARRSIESGLHTVRMALALGSEREGLWKRGS